ncbi:MAG: epoxyqueuosine reductase [Candidatus Bathyarchaeota archaeon]|nr:MAG: epoxyqueuosine reductase [Candidatus Bathyarchaeota archaeon]
MSKLRSWVEGLVKAFVDSPENTMQNQENERAWGEPLVGFSSGADPLYLFYKEDIGSFFMTPLEWFTETFPGVEVEAKELTVISWILPQTEVTKTEHRKQIRWPTDRWARARIYGEEVNAKLRKHVMESLKDAGYEAVSPQLSPLWKGSISEKYGRASSWSERHAAYTAGLGTFGLCDGLITPVGKAMRTGSVVARIELPPTPRPYEDHHAYCLLYMRGTCGICIDRCPAGAISEEGHDKEKCSSYLDLTREYVRENFGFKGYGCGLCQTGVPCESLIPPELAMDLNLPASSTS